jgi:hypothetical protein
MSNDDKGLVPLKRTMNPKNRAAIAELKDIDINNLTPREQVLLRVINALEKELDEHGNPSDS